MARIADLSSFWPYYLSEHANLTSRLLHFCGTTLFVALALGSLIANPLWFGVGLAVAVAAVAWGVANLERHQPAFWPMGVAVLALVVGSGGVMFAGILAGYAFAWVGHFGFEKNRPATFSYPAYSLVSDFRLWTEMIRGRYWSAELTSVT